MKQCKDPFVNQMEFPISERINKLNVSNEIRMESEKRLVTHNVFTFCKRIYVAVAVATLVLLIKRVIWYTPSLIKNSPNQTHPAPSRAAQRRD